MAETAMQARRTMAQRRADRLQLLKALASIQPIEGGVGGWEDDPYGNARKRMRPRRPIIITSAILQSARAALEAEKERVLRLQGDLDSQIRRYTQLHEHPGRFVADHIRHEVSTSWNTLSQAVVLREHGLCWHCGRQGAEVDHIRERVLGGADCMENLMLLCGSCHWSKTCTGELPLRFRLDEPGVSR
jgi:5-methylcytosine-specific restriction endonuclease McrA